jgi:cytochrome c553
MRRVRLLVLGMLSLSLAAPGYASRPATDSAATPRSPVAAELRATLAAQPRGDLQRGKALHQSLMCAACHGETGVAPTGNWSSLAGQRAAYTYKSLLDYQRGDRHEDDRANLMAVVVRDMTRQDMADVADYYASLPPPPAAAPKLTGETRRHIEQLVRRGDPARLLTPCASCHGASGQGGNNETPALAGQSVGSLAQTLHDYRSGRRVTDANQGMRQFAQRLTPDEIEALAKYYASLSGKRR